MPAHPMPAHPYACPSLCLPIPCLPIPMPARSSLRLILKIKGQNEQTKSTLVTVAKKQPFCHAKHLAFTEKLSIMILYCIL